MSRTRPPEPVEPSIPPTKGKRLLEAMKSQGEKLLANRPIPEHAYEIWYTTTIEYIGRIFGSGTGHISTFTGLIDLDLDGAYELSPQGEENRRADILKKKLGVLGPLIEALDLQIAVNGDVQAPQGQEKTFDFWSLMHPAVVKHGRSRFNTKHYADAVEAVMKALNNLVKELVKEETGEELDGASLMHTAFSPKSPIIVLDDLSTASGKDTQQGYMEMYAGAMTGIRNPKAHGNVRIDENQAIHLLFFASHLFYKLRERR